MDLAPMQSGTRICVDVIIPISIVHSGFLVACYLSPTYLRRYENVMGRHKWNHLSSTIKTVMWKVSPRKESTVELFALNLGKVSYVLTVLGTAS
ncbi:unnamed protein product [Arabidopsis halleri]